MNLHDLLKEMVERGASDLHLTTGAPPMLRLHGRITPLGDTRLTAPETKSLAYSVLTDTQKQQFEEEKELDLSFGVKGLSRFRANVYIQRGVVGMAIRTIPYVIQSFEELGLPKIVGDLCEKPKGLILVTGPTGSGKSTTLATMIDKISSERSEHIVTIEDPIEFVHPHKSCIVNQREVHSDTRSFTEALRRVFRQDPDKVLIGEMRDQETIAAALTIAETGHLTFATLHTNSCVESINRIIDVFPPHQQSQIRAQLSFVLECVLCQALIPKSAGSGDHDPESRHPQSHPGGQGPPDLLGDANRPGEVRDADDESVTPRALSETDHHAGGSDAEELDAGGTVPDDPAGSGGQ